MPGWFISTIPKFIFKSKRNFTGWLVWSVDSKLTLQPRFKVQCGPNFKTKSQRRPKQTIVSSLMAAKRQQQVKKQFISTVQVNYNYSECATKNAVFRTRTGFTSASKATQRRPAVIHEAQSFVDGRQFKLRRVKRC